MEEEIREFFQGFDAFRKLNVFRIVPEIGQYDYSVLKAIELCSTNQVLHQELREDIYPDMSADLQHVKVSDVVRHMACAPPAVSRSLKTLETKGWIYRESDKNDRRNTVVKLTREGERMIRQTDAIMRDFLSNVLDHMGREEMQEFNRSMNRFRDVMAEEIEKHEKMKQKKGAVTDEADC